LKRREEKRREEKRRKRRLICLFVYKEEAEGKITRLFCYEPPL
jgi:hypothetical protein